MKDERLTPKPLIHKHEEFPEHDWYRTEDGEIDEFAMSVGFHNGPCHTEANLRDSEMCKKMTSCPECRKAYWGEEVE